MRKTFLIVLVMFFQHAFGNDTTSAKKIKILPVPAFGYSPETKTYVGLVSLFTFKVDENTRTSNAKIELNYTWRKQIIFDANWNYFFNHEKYFTKGHLLISKFPDFYFGIGFNTPDSNRISYNSKRIDLDNFFLVKVYPNIFTGFNVRYAKYTLPIAEEYNLKYKELNDEEIAGLGYAILKDSRNNILTPTSGSYRLINTSYQISKKNYWKVFYDFRSYKTWKNKYTLANRIFGEFNSNNPPFFDLAKLGGDAFVRGYYFGRYRDLNMASLQTEMRIPLFWRIGMSGFGGLSVLCDKNLIIKNENFKYNLGIGIRFCVDKKDKTNLRFDYGIGNNKNQGFYVAFGEAF